MRMAEMIELNKIRNSQDVLADSKGALSTSHQGVTFIWRK